MANKVPIMLNSQILVNSSGSPILVGPGYAYVKVTAPAGSLLTLRNQTYQLGESETEHQFTVETLGSYTLTGTLDDKSDTQTVLVDMYAIFSVEVTYN